MVGSSGLWLRKSRSDRIYSVFNTTFLSVALIAAAYPLIYVLSASFSSADAASSGKVWLFPVEPTFQAYKVIFEYRKIWIGYGNSLFYATVGTAINVVLTILAAYPLSRRDFKARHIYMGLFVFTMLFNAGIIPNYLLVKSLGMLNTRWAMLLPPAVAVWNVIITRTYYQTVIAPELIDAAQLDGCSEFRFIMQIVIPLSGAITAVNALFYAVFHWNSFFQAFIYLNKEELYPLQIFLRAILIINTFDVELLDPKELEAMEGLRDLLQFALIIVASLPVLAIYPFVQKYFVRGVMIGSLKG
jgi:putative aldouronate transport system permease protein